MRTALLLVLLAGSARAADRKPRVLLLGQKPDNHAWSAHEYMDGMRILAECLGRDGRVNTVVVKADAPWNEGPELLDGADGAVLFLTEGAKWIGEDRTRLAAFERLARRRGGLVCLHWAMGCRDARFVESFANLFGGCHGGPDRKYKIAALTASIGSPEHPVSSGLRDFTVEDEFYYRLKPPKSGGKIDPIVRVPIEGETFTVGWAWQRPDGGRSFGFSGGHFHKLWEKAEYRRLMTQGTLWTLNLPIPAKGVDVDIPAESLALRRPKPIKK